MKIHNIVLQKINIKNNIWHILLNNKKKYFFGDNKVKLIKTASNHNYRIYKLNLYRSQTHTF
jgi:hypothetical protein